MQLPEIQSPYLMFVLLILSDLWVGHELELRIADQK